MWSLGTLGFFLLFVQPREGGTSITVNWVVDYKKREKILARFKSPTNMRRKRNDEILARGGKMGFSHYKHLFTNLRVHLISAITTGKVWKYLLLIFFLSN